MSTRKKKRSPEYPQLHMTEAQLKAVRALFDSVADKSPLGRDGFYAEFSGIKAALDQLPETEYFPRIFAEQRALFGDAFERLGVEIPENLKSLLHPFR